MEEQSRAKFVNIVRILKKSCELKFEDKLRTKSCVLKENRASLGKFVRLLRSANQKPEKAILHAEETLDDDFHSKTTGFFNQIAYSLFPNKPKRRNTKN